MTHTHIYKRNQMAAVLPRVWRIGQILRIFLTVHYLPFPPLPPFPLSPPSPPEVVWGTSECIFRMHFPAREMESQPSNVSRMEARVWRRMGIGRSGGVQRTEGWGRWRTHGGPGVGAGATRSIILASNTHNTVKGNFHKI